MARGVGVVYLDGQGQAKTIEASGAALGFSLETDPGTLKLAYGLAIADLYDAIANGVVSPIPPTDDHWKTVFINYMWSPITNVTYGDETGYHQSETVRGESGDAPPPQDMVIGKSPLLSFLFIDCLAKCGAFLSSSIGKEVQFTMKGK